MGAAASIEQWPPVHRAVWEARRGELVSDNGAHVDLSPLAWYERDVVTDGHLASLLHAGVESLDLRGCAALTITSARLIADACEQLRDVDFERCDNLGNVGVFAVQGVVRHCRRLSRLSLRRWGAVTNESLATLAAARRLGTLDLAGCTNLSKLTALPASLTCLNVSDCVRLAAADGLVDCAATLVVLRAAGTRFVDFGVIARCHALEELDVSRAGPAAPQTSPSKPSPGLSDASLESIARGCPRLARLSVRGHADATDAGILAFGARLTALDASDCARLTDGALSVGAFSELRVAECPRLTKLHHGALAVLDARACDGVGAGVERLGTCGHLYSLDLSGVAVRDSGLLAIALGCALTVLRVRGCGELTDAALSAVASSCAGLTVLDVSFCGRLTDVGLIVLGSCCTELRELHVAGLRLATDAGLSGLHCPDLRELDASSTSLTSAGLEAALEGAPRLARLAIADCRALDDDALAAICAHAAESLVELDARRCGFDELPGDFGDALARLERCDLSGNRLRVCVESVARLRIRRPEDLDLRDNPWRRPPAAVVADGLDAIHEWYDDELGAKDHGLDRHPPVGYPATEFRRSQFATAGRFDHRGAPPKSTRVMRL